ncbi:hypothetical protein [Nocardioides sp. AX2bis]|uniref:hypothetical protein n=1 Tax=Nocardioides sp. AX2bis TaxID=2653157 RepID=UPI0012F3F92E|nr:hypothetical protein [Nocardioides sp. AX2bis]VXC03627.1 hypothetical protein NOCARDAX2BIS_400113 [Nocardioides sp. AX2bis]
MTATSPVTGADPDRATMCTITPLPRDWRPTTFRTTRTSTTDENPHHRRPRSDETATHR